MIQRRPLGSNGKCKPPSDPRDWRYKQPAAEKLAAEHVQREETTRFSDRGNDEHRE